MKINGVNLGNWLVLEKWMNPTIFEGTKADDEYYLAHDLEKTAYKERMRIHRAEYITERDLCKWRHGISIPSGFPFHILFLAIVNRSLVASMN